jgi:chromosome segregation ATPase
MLGIVIGLFAMPSISDANFEKAIDILIGGVKIAMIASFTGLLLTVLLSGWRYKGAKTKAEGLKNDFFTWIQTHLLPVLSQNISSSIYSLQANLLKFNDTFETNIHNFNGLMNRILDSFEGQTNLMNDLKDVDVAQLAKLNVNVLQELRTSTKEFEKFNTYLHQVNSFVDNAQKLNFSINNQLERTHSMEKIADSIGTNIDMNKEIIDILQSELREVSSRKQMVSDAVIDVDNVLSKSLEQLKIHIDTQIKAITDITIKEEDLLEKLLKEDRGNLNELKKLGQLKTSMSSMEQEAKVQNNKLDALNASIDKLSDAILNQKQQTGLEILKPIKYAGYVFVYSGAIIGVVFSGWKIFEFIFK